MWTFKKPTESHLFSSLGMMSVITCLGMTGFECLKLVMFPEMPLWQSPVLTIMAATVLTAVSGAIALKTSCKRTRDTLHQSEAQYRMLVENCHDIIFTVDLAGNFLFVNTAFQRVLGFSEQESRQLNGFDLVHPADLPRVEKTFAEFLQGKAIKNVEYRYQKKDGNFLSLATNGVPLYDETGTLYAALGISRDITDRKRAEDALRESEARIRRKLESILSPEEDLKELELADILDIPAIQALMDDFFHLTRIGIAILDLHGNVLVATGWQDICTQFHRIHPETRQHCLESDLALSSGVEPGTFKIYKCKNNMWDMVTPIIVGDQHAGNLFLGQFFFDDELPDYELFRAQARQYGFNEEDYLTALDRVPRWSRETVNTVMSFYTRFATLIATLSYSNIKLARTLAERDNLLMSLAQSEARLRSYIENAPHGVFIADEHGRYLEVNPAASTITGYEAEELVQMRISDLAPPESLEYAAQHFQQVVESGQASGETTFKHKSGEIRYWSIDAVKLSPTRFMGFVQDITDRKQAEEQIKAALKEKEVLLREIHHRVKNNLMVVTSLIEMQAGQTSNPDALTLFRDLRNRVQAMAMVHIDLYRTENLSYIGFHTYLQRLVLNIRQSFARTDATVTIAADDIFLDVQQAIPCGLIVAELVTNAFKYAFRPGRRSAFPSWEGLGVGKKGSKQDKTGEPTPGPSQEGSRQPTPGPSQEGNAEIRVEMRKTENTYTLIVSDNGVGLPPEFDLHRSNTLGMSLMRSWVMHQLKGKIEVDTQQGTRFTITFIDMNTAKRS